MKWIKDFEDGDRIIGQLLVTGALKGVTEKGMNYLNVTFQDKSGTIEAKNGMQAMKICKSLFLAQSLWLTRE